MADRERGRGPAYVRQRPDYSESLREQAAWQAEVRHGEWSKLGGCDIDYIT
jgi:hypothetical protein